MDYSLSDSLFGSWSALAHTLIAGTLTYIGLIVWLRISGKRTLSKWNSFDFVVTIAFGSMLASAFLNKSTSFVQSMVAIGLLVTFQYAITWLSVRSNAIQKLVKAEPSLLVFKGKLLEDIMTDKRVAKGEILAAIRVNGTASIEDIDAVVLETDGTFSVVQKLDVESASAFKDVNGFRDSAIAYASGQSR